MVHLYSYCGVKDPSWAEIRHFVTFLDLQLQSCERSCFCNEKVVGDIISGFKTFVVKFMIRMSRVSIYDVIGHLYAVLTYHLITYRIFQRLH